MRRKHFMILCTAALLALTVVSRAESTGTPSPDILTVQSKSFDTPEKAINWFVAHVAEGDLAGAMSACMINELDGFDFAAYMKWLNALHPWQMPAPANSDMFRTLNRIQRIGMISMQIKIMIYSLLTDMNLDGSIIAPLNDEMIAGWVKQSDMDKLKGLRVAKVRLPVEKDILESERARSNAKRNAAFYGGDDSTERIVLYKLNDGYFWGGYHLVRFGKNWKIDGLNSSYANISTLGNLERTTPDKFESIGDDL